MSQFQTIGLMGRGVNREAVESLRVLADFLVEQGIKVVVDEKLMPLLPGDGLDARQRRDVGALSDMVIVVGGDGSLLGAARDLVHHDVPVLGVNRGKLGFLTDIKPSDIKSKVSEVLAGNYEKEQRFLIGASVERDGEEIAKGSALNDVVLNSGTTGRMISFDLYVDERLVYRQQSDGLIVATPTGSTAYALSAGGPILHPTLDAVVLVPMYPHTLSSRPLVVDGNSTIRVEIGSENTNSLPVTCDGQVKLSAKPNDIVTIRKMNHKLTLIHPLDHCFYDSCRVKLGWSSRPSN